MLPDAYRPRRENPGWSLFTEQLPSVGKMIEEFKLQHSDVGIFLDIRDQAGALLSGYRMKGKGYTFPLRIADSRNKKLLELQVYPLTSLDIAHIGVLADALVDNHDGIKKGPSGGVTSSIEKIQTEVHYFLEADIASFKKV